MRIAVFNQHFDIGGVETLLLSLLPQFVRLGHHVDVYLLEPDRANATLPELTATGVLAHGIDRLRHASSPVHYDVALATNPATLFTLFGLIQQQRLHVACPLVGVYQTRMFCLDRGVFDMHNRLTKALFGKIDPRNVVFGNDACRDEHASAIPAMAHAPVVPLIVDLVRFARRPAWRGSDPLKIVSIGRLDHFKTYNLSMPAVLRRLRDAGHPVVWDVYGDGPLRADMQRSAQAHGVQAHVRLHGPVAYGAIPGVLAEAFAFVGSGLAMMEAAACGVPAVPAIEYSDKPQTYGLAHELEGISFFEPGLAWPRHDIADKLLQLLRATPESYESMGDAGRAKMALFSAETVALRYLEVMAGATRARPVLSAASRAVYRLSAGAHRRARAWRLGLRLRRN